MILLLAIFVGLVAGLARAHIGGRKYHAPQVQSGWLLLVAVVPQLFAFYVPDSTAHTSDNIASFILISSQLALLVFVWTNLDLPGFWILGLGLVLNLVVISLNGGLMPISPDTIKSLSPAAVIDPSHFGSRLGSSKDILVAIKDTNLWLLSDCLTLPEWVPYRVAFSLGDVLIAIGVFWLLWIHGSVHESQNRILKSTKTNNE